MYDLAGIPTVRTPTPSTAPYQLTTGSSYLDRIILGGSASTTGLILIRNSATNTGTSTTDQGSDGIKLRAAGGRFEPATIDVQASFESGIAIYTTAKVNVTLIYRFRSAT